MDYTTHIHPYICYCIMGNTLSITLIHFLTLKWSSKSLETAYGAPITTSETYWKKNVKKENLSLVHFLLSGWRVKRGEGEREEGWSRTHSTGQHTEGSLMDVHDGVILPFVSIHLLNTTESHHRYRENVRPTPTTAWWPASLKSG